MRAKFMVGLWPSSMLAVFVGSASAGIFNLPPAIVPSDAATNGPSFVLAEPILPTDTIRGVVSGTVDFNSNNSNDYSADWNAAGIVVETRCTRLAVGGSDPEFVDIGWLRLAIGNDSIGFFPLLEPSAANGFGSANPPTLLTVESSAASIFNSVGFTGLPAGTQLSYRIYDSPVFDNSGAFIVSQVPEPILTTAVVPCHLLLARRRRRHRIQRCD